MAVTFTERDLSRSREDGPSATIELRFTARGSDDDQEIYDEAFAELPAVFDGKGARRIRVEPIAPELGIWDVIATYRVSDRVPPPPEEGQSRVTFAVRAATTRVTHAKETIVVSSILPDLPPANLFGEAINVTEDGVDGTDVVVPEASFEETHYLGPDTVTPEYRNALLSMVGRVNHATWRGRPKGEILITGISGGYRQADALWEITFQFAVSPNASGLTVAGHEGVDKEGWHYLWVHYEPVVDGSVLSRRGRFVVVQRVYDYADFTTLGIGT